MALNSINTNIAAYSAQGNIGRASNSASASIARLSSGNRITQASDDVAALSIGTSLRTGVTTLKTALLNANQGSSLLQVADGALSQLSEILQRQKAIATQASSGSVGDAERGFLNQEFQALTNEINRIAGSTNFNGVKLINGGLGTNSTLAGTNAVAGAFVPASSGQTGPGTFVASTTPIQAFNIQTGVVANNVANVGNLQFVDSGGTALANAAFGTVNTAISGQFSEVKLDNLVFGAAGVGSGRLTMTIGGVELSGNVVSNAAAQTVTISNGSTYMQVRIGALSLTDQAAANNAEQSILDAFRFTGVQRTSTINGVDFSGTRLEGATGIAGTGIAIGRFNTSNVTISNFQYSGNTGANTNRLTVDVNGTTFYTLGLVNDSLTSAAGKISFQSDDWQAFSIDLTGLDLNITNMRTNLQERTEFLNALNAGFSKAGSGLDFQVGSTAADSLKVSISSANAVSLFNGQSLGVTTASDAAIAGSALDGAIAKVTSLRADVGALQSRFNFASANLESSIQNQDAARGTLLDTDVSAESTAYATAQVQMQAGIAVLAQANQLPQNLLKLIS